MGGFLHLAGIVTIALGVIAAVATAATAASTSPAAALISAAIWLISSAVSGCVLIALGQIHERVTDIWAWTRAQQTVPHRPAAPDSPHVQPARPVAEAPAAAPDLTGSLAGRAALWAKLEQTTPAQKD